MIRLAVALVLLLLVYAVAAVPTPYPCTFSAPNGKNYDLSPMYRNPSLDVPDFQYYAPDMSFFYVYAPTCSCSHARALGPSELIECGCSICVTSNICGQTAEEQCNPPNGVCQIASWGAGYGDGDASHAQWNTLRMLPSQSRAPLPIQHRSHLTVLSMLCSKRRRRSEDHVPERQRGLVQWLAASQLRPSLLRRGRRRWRDRQCHRVAGGALPVHDHVRPPSLQRLVAARPHKPCGETRSMRSKWACSGPPPPPPALPEDQRACCQYVPRCTQTPLAE